MKAIVSKTAETVRIAAQMLGRFYDKCCRKLAQAEDVTAMRIAGSVLTLPVFLLAAALATGLVLSAMELAMLVTSLVGMTMIFCALSLMGVSAFILGLFNFAAYGIGLATLSVVGENNAALWLMVACLPFELWLTWRQPVAVAAGVFGAVLIFALSVTSFVAPVVQGSTASIVVVILYAASLVARSLALALQANQQNQNAVQIAVADGDVRIALDRDGMVVSVGVSSAQCLGIEPHTLEGTALLDRVHVADRVSYLSLLADLREGKPGSPPGLRADIRLRAMEDGATIFHSYRMEGTNSDGIITLVGRSLAGEQKLMDEIAALKAQLQSERHGKERLLAALSHELRTPLNSIIGFSDMLSNDIGGKLATEKQREYVGLIHQSGHYLLELVNAVLDNSQLETGTYSIAPQEFSFREVVELCNAVMLPQAEKRGLAFCHRVHQGIGAVVADRRAVQQILLNLAANAVKFTQAGGCVTIDATRVVADGRPMLEFSISDTGIGMTADDLERIGMPFVRADNSFTRAQEGCGLGLSVVKGLVELHQGTMSLKSQPGEGTVVTIRLPVAGPQYRTKEDENTELGAVSGMVPGMVIDMHCHQGERCNDWQKDTDQEKGSGWQDAQDRKTA